MSSVPHRYSSFIETDPTIDIESSDENSKLISNGLKTTRSKRFITFQSIDSNSVSTTYLRAIRRSVFLSGLLTIVLVLLFYFYMIHVSNNTIEYEESLEFTVSRWPYETLRSLDYLPWYAIAEPFRSQTFNVSYMTLRDESFDFTALSKLIEINWKIDGSSYSGVSVNVYINRLGEIPVELKIIDKSNSYSYTKEFVIMSKYIRREIRSLTFADRENFFNSLQLIYQMSQTEGEARYGIKFKSAETLLQKHLLGAATSDCDHWHDGAGIVTHHAAYTLFAEQALQSIDKTIAMPYWEYAMDYYYYTNDHWMESPFFNDDWFSEASPNNPLHAVQSGRWANVSVPNGSSYKDWNIESTGSLNPFVNALGHLRSPWNNNPSPYISRHNMTYGLFSKLGRPGCSAMSDCYASTSIAQMNDCLNGYTHGPIHIVIGGAWGEGQLFDDISMKFLQKANKLLLFKMLWRFGWSRCPVSCNIQIPSSCICGVPQDYLDEYGVTYILESSGVLIAIAKELSRLPRPPDITAFHTTILRTIESPGVAGDMFTSGAPWDPTFWPLHGSIERLLGLKRIAISKDLIDASEFNETWGYETDNFNYLRGRCDWSHVSSPLDLTLPTCTMGEDILCSGHNEFDILEFSGFIEGHSQDVYYTNSDLYAFIHPWNKDLPYTYDSLDYDYCLEFYPDMSSTYSFDSLVYRSYE